MPSNTKFDPPNTNYFDKTSLNKDAKGVIATAAHGTTTNLDLTLTDDVLMTGGIFLAKGAAWGDKVDFQVLHPTYGVIAQFITDWYLNPDTTEQPIPKSSYPAKLVTGLTLRVVYHSVGETDVEIAVNYDREKVLV